MSAGAATTRRRWGWTVAPVLYADLAPDFCMRKPRGPLDEWTAHENLNPSLPGTTNP